RRLVDAIEVTDGIVYVEEGNCHHKARACLPPIVTAADKFRFLRIVVDARQQDWRVMADIGHELQHALEVLADPYARSNDRLFFLALQANFGTTEIRETRE